MQQEEAAPVQVPSGISQPGEEIPESNATADDDASDWDSTDEDDGYETADSFESSGDEEEVPQTEEERKADREAREIERQRVLEAAGLIIMKSERAPPPRPARRKSVRKHRPAPAVPAQVRRQTHDTKDLPNIPGSESQDTSLRLDDAYERYEAHKQSNAQLNRLSTASLDTSSSFASPSVSFTRSPSVDHEGRSHSNFLSFFGRKTPANDGEGRTMPVISGPILISGPTLKDSASTTSIDSEFGAVSLSLQVWPRTDARIRPGPA